MPTSLKHHARYQRALKRYATAINLSLRYVAGAPDEGIYNPRRKTVKIDSDLPETERVAATLHELGHALDDSISWSEDSALNSRIMVAYAATYSTKAPSRKQRRLVLRCEKAAWRYGRVIAKQLNIKLGKWYYDYMELCLKSYRGK